KALVAARLGGGDVKAWGTPRRLAVTARGLAERQEDARTQALGPPIASAFDAQGKPTAAALGFAKSQGVSVEKLKKVMTPKGERLAAEKIEVGRKAEEILPGILEALIAGLKFKKVMRW